MLKEKGYDEFLAEQKTVGKWVIFREEFVTKEDMGAEIKALFYELSKNERDDKFEVQTS